MRKVGSKGSPTAKSFKSAAKTAKKVKKKTAQGVTGMKQSVKINFDLQIDNQQIYLTKGLIYEAAKVCA